MKHYQTTQVLTWQAANTMVSAAINKAEQLGVLINVAVVDNGGNLAAFLRMPNAYLHSIDIAIDKAYTSAGFKFATSEWKPAFANDKMLEKGMLSRDRLVVMGGGVPITIDGHHLGGIGVSGASEQEDIVCAEAAIAALMV